MFIEKKRKGVSPRPLTSNGTVNGVITLADTSDLFVKQIIYLASNTQGPKEYEIKRFVNNTSFKVGPKGSSITSYADISTFLVMDGAVLSAPEQDRPGITEKEHERAVYAEEPIVAKRVIQVDENGNYYNSDNRLPVDIGTSVSLEGDLIVDIDAIDDFVNPDNAFAVGTEDGTKNGTRHVHRVDSDLDLRVGISYGDNKAEVDGLGRLLVFDSAANTALISLLASSVSIDSKIPALGQAPMSGSLPVTIASDQSPIPVAVQGEPLIISGTEDGTPTGTEFAFVNNVRLQILSAKDREQQISYADFGTKNQRVIQIDYTAPSVGAGPGFTARQSISYSLVGNRYRRDSINWSIL